jgi:hypothetical protein
MIEFLHSRQDGLEAVRRQLESKPLSQTLLILLRDTTEAAIVARDGGYDLYKKRPLNDRLLTSANHLNVEILQAEAVLLPYVNEQGEVIIADVQDKAKATNGSASGSGSILASSMANSAEKDDLVDFGTMLIDDMPSDLSDVAAYLKSLVPVRLDLEGLAELDPLGLKVDRVRAYMHAFGELFQVARYRLMEAIERGEKQSLFKEAIKELDSYLKRGRSLWQKCAQLQEEEQSRLESWLSRYCSRCSQLLGVCAESRDDLASESGFSSGFGSPSQEMGGAATASMKSEDVNPTLANEEKPKAEAESVKAAAVFEEASSREDVGLPSLPKGGEPESACLVPPKTRFPAVQNDPRVVVRAAATEERSSILVEADQSMKKPGVSKLQQLLSATVIGPKWGETPPRQQQISATGKAVKSKIPRLCQVKQTPSKVKKKVDVVSDQSFQRDSEVPAVSVPSGLSGGFQLPKSRGKKRSSVVGKASKGKGFQGTELPINSGRKVSPDSDQLRVVRCAMCRAQGHVLQGCPQFKKGQGKAGKTSKLATTGKRVQYLGRFYCVLCEVNGHSLSHCPRFKEMEVESRLQLCRQKRVHFACLKRHRSGECKIPKSKRKCGVDKKCPHAHHWLLHAKKFQLSAGQSASKFCEGAGGPSREVVSPSTVQSSSCMAGSASCCSTGASEESSVSVPVCSAMATIVYPTESCCGELTGPDRSQLTAEGDHFEEKSAEEESCTSTGAPGVELEKGQFRAFSVYSVSQFPYEAANEAWDVFTSWVAKLAKKELDEAMLRGCSSGYIQPSISILKEGDGISNRSFSGYHQPDFIQFKKVFIQGLIDEISWQFGVRLEFCLEEMLSSNNDLGYPGQDIQQ